MNEELKMIVEMIQNLQGDALLAFLAYLAKDCVIAATIVSAFISIAWIICRTVRKVNRV